MNKTNVLIGLIIVAAISVVALDVFKQEQESQPIEDSSAEIVFEKTEFDFGVLKQSAGIVTHDFPFTYIGDIERKIVAVPGSCACTTAEVNIDVLKPGEQGVLTVTFDPNLHEEPEGRFYKTAALLTEPLLENEAEVKIWAEIDLDLGPEFYKLSSKEEEGIEVDDHSAGPYGEIHADELVARLENKNFFLLDVHIPEQNHIDNTDAFIPFTELENRLSELPTDKNTEIVVYCRSGSMSQVAAQDLIEFGYTNVKNLEGGKRAFDKQNN